MHLTVHRVAGLPPLAWWACVRADGCVTVMCGDAVEAQEGPGGWWFEGAWAGDFASTRPDACAGCFGSGGRVTRDGVRIIGPSHTLERVWVLPGSRDRNGLPRTWASNSLPLLLAASGERLDWRYRLYVHDLHSVVLGVPGVVRDLPLAGGGRVHSTFADMIEVDWRGHITRAAHRVPPEPRDFDGVRALLADTARATAHNAADPSRRACFTPITTVSGGYDSPASAVLAREAGCQDAVLFVRGRTTGSQPCDDDGRPVARALGLHATLYERTDYQSLTCVPEAWCLALGELQDLPFCAMHDQLQGRLLFTGHVGGLVFDLDPGHGQPWPRQARQDYSGSTLTELRLRAGFVACHLATVLYEHVDALARISRSDSMAPWRLECGWYDRPIARRIIEGAGVARGTFATHKAAVSLGYRSFVGDLRASMTERGWTEFDSYVARQPRFGLLTSLRWKIGDMMDKRRVERLRRARARGEPVPAGLTSELHARRYLYTRTMAESAFHWANDRLRQEYEQTLGTHGPGTAATD